MVRYLRDEPLNFYSVLTARATLDVAHLLLRPELARLSIDYITANLSTSTVLVVYHGLDLYVPDTMSPLLQTPTAPPAPGDDAGAIGNLFGH